MKSIATFSKEDFSSPKIGDLYVSHNKLHIVMITDTSKEGEGTVIWRANSSLTQIGNVKRLYDNSKYHKFHGRVEITQ